MRLQSLPVKLGARTMTEHDEQGLTDHQRGLWAVLKPLEANLTFAFGCMCVEHMAPVYCSVSAVGFAPAVFREGLDVAWDATVGNRSALGRAKREVARLAEVELAEHSYTAVSAKIAAGALALLFDSILEREPFGVIEVAEEIVASVTEAVREPSVRGAVTSQQATALWNAPLVLRERERQADEVQKLALVPGPVSRATAADLHAMSFRNGLSSTGSTCALPRSRYSRAAPFR